MRWLSIYPIDLYDDGLNAIYVRLLRVIESNDSGVGSRGESMYSVYGIQLRALLYIVPALLCTSLRNDGGSSREL